MPNKTIKLVEPNLTGATLTLELWDDATEIGDAVASATASNGVWTFVVSAAVTAKWYIVKLYEGAQLVGWGWVNFPDGDIVGTYEVGFKDRFDEIVDAVNNIELPSPTVFVVLPATTPDGETLPLSTGRTVYRGTHWRFGFSNVGTFNPGDKFYFTLKRRIEDEDILIQVNSEEGLTTFFSQEITDSDLASIAYSADDDSTYVALEFSPEITQHAELFRQSVFDIKVISEVYGTKELVQNHQFSILPDITRNIS